MTIRGYVSAPRLDELAKAEVLAKLQRDGLIGDPSLFSQRATVHRLDDGSVLVGIAEVTRG